MSEDELPEPETGWRGCHFPGEQKAIAAVVRAGAEHGYGNMIHHLKLAWERHLLEGGVGAKGAAYGSTLACPWCGVDSRTGRKWTSRRKRS